VSVAIAVLAVLVVVAFFVFTAIVKIVQEYERGAIFRLGRLLGPRGLVLSS
jgi:regulator of protease activity HflC (stomatin/prohibitin superfamily)